MGFFSEFNKALKGEEGGDKYEVAGIAVSCPHCKGDHFLESEALLDGRGASIFGMEGFGAGATTLTCTKCGYVSWFADAKLVEKVE